MDQKSGKDSQDIVVMIFHGALMRQDGLYHDVLKYVSFKVEVCTGEPSLLLLLSVVLCMEFIAGL